MKILQVNSFDFLSTGNIMLNIADIARENGIEMYTASKKKRISVKSSKNLKNHYLIGTILEHELNKIFSEVTDLQDYGSIFSTYKFIQKVKDINPDIIHIHDIAGHYLNIDMFFKFLKKYDKPVIWTFHCCWAYTGRCIYYDYINCNKWKDGCFRCEQNRKSFPKHILFDFSRFNYNHKKKLFTSVNNLTIVTPSEWLHKEVENSFFRDCNIETILNGIDQSIFFPEENKELLKKYNISNEKVILGVASIWSDRKGLKYFIDLSKSITSGYKIVLIGLSKEQISDLPPNIIGLEKTFSVEELRRWYTVANVFVNPTMEEVFGLVNIEAQACGTPVITFATGGSVECVSKETGIVVEKGNTNKLKEAIEFICTRPKSDYSEKCIRWARKFEQRSNFLKYIELYKKIYGTYMSNESKN